MMCKNLPFSPSYQKCVKGNFWPRWRHRGIHCTSLHNQKKDNDKFKNEKQPELPENQTPWKSNNPGVKETFIHTGRRGGNGQQGREDTWQASGLCRRGRNWWTRPSHILMRISQEEHLGSETRFQHRK